MRSGRAPAGAFAVPAEAEELGSFEERKTAPVIKARRTPDGLVIRGDLNRRFRTLSEVGRHASSRVWKARHLESNRLVSLKLLPVGTPTAQRLRSVPRILSRLDHPNIPPYVEHGETLTGWLYLAVEWRDGHSLEEHIQRGPMPVKDAVQMLTCVATALGAAHANGIIHRDVSPSNILLGDGRPDRTSVLDFGLARLLGGQRITERGRAIGTPQFMSPEQVRAQDDVDARADVFALGCVAYYALSESAPFEGAHTLEVVTNILCADPISLELCRADVPHGLALLVQKMLEKDPADRPEDGAAVAKALESLA